jgi:hypothetical protein
MSDRVTTPSGEPPAITAFAVWGTVGAVGIIFVNILLGIGLVWDCRREGGEVMSCWKEGVALSGLGSTGPLVIALGIAGQHNRQSWRDGYNTLNPALRDPRAAGPDPNDSTP